jgi:A/G-specific adenine glycosylase
LSCVKDLPFNTFSEKRSKLINFLEKPDFTVNLLHWHEHVNDRQMPWKGEPDPYRIWLSEIILQQTRVEQGLAYYERFISTFPTVTDLANAPEQEVFKLWEGLGYYSRCRNLIATAKTIVADFNGKFPASYKELLSLKGVGSYTASAIASFAFNLPHAVVDGNVFRVLSRYFGINTPIDSLPGRKIYEALANALLPQDKPALFNQAIMDFGATVCKPRQPLCDACAQRNDCQALQHGWTDFLPVKEKKLTKKVRFFNYFIVRTADKWFIYLRTKKDIWQDLHEFLLVETDEPTQLNEQTARLLVRDHLLSDRFEVGLISGEFRQVLTHQVISTRFVVINTENAVLKDEGYMAISPADLGRYAFPKIITTFLSQNVVKQQLF